MQHKIYQTIEELLNENYLNLITLANCIQEMSVRDKNYRLYKDEAIHTTHKEYINLAVRLDYQPDEAIPALEEHINTQINNFFISQDVITHEDFLQMKQVNIEYLKVFWNDLKMFKGFENIIEIRNEIGVPLYEDIREEIENKETVIALANAGFEEEHISVYFTSIEDKTVMTSVLLYLTNEAKITMINFYNESNLIEHKEQDYEEYLLGITRDAYEAKK